MNRSAGLGTRRTVTIPIRGTSHSDVSSRLSLMGRAPIPNGFPVIRLRDSGSMAELSADPDEHAQEQADEPDGQKHQVIAQTAGLKRPAPVAGHIHGLGSQVDQA